MENKSMNRIIVLNDNEKQRYNTILSESDALSPLKNNI